MECIEYFVLAINELVSLVNTLYIHKRLRR